MQTLSEIRSLLAERGLRPKQRLGQHFLHDGNHLRRLVEEAAVEPGEVVLEVGPGTGSLTEALLGRGAEVVACEIDGDLAEILDERLGDRVRLVRGDCLQRSRSLNPAVAEALGGRPFKLVANLPFQVASTLIGVLLIGHPECGGQFVTVQKEVADRLAAAPGTPATKAYGALSIIVQAFADVRRLAILPPTCFWPQPAVTSAMFALRPKDDRGIDDPAAFATFVTSLFTKRRKQLGTILGRSWDDWPPGVTPDLRPEALTVEQMVALWRAQLLIDTDPDRPEAPAGP